MEYGRVVQVLPSVIFYSTSDILSIVSSQNIVMVYSSLKVVLDYFFLNMASRQSYYSNYCRKSAMKIINYEMALYSLGNCTYLTTSLTNFLTEHCRELCIATMAIFNVSKLHPLWLFFSKLEQVSQTSIIVILYV